MEEEKQIVGEGRGKKWEAAILEGLKPHIYSVFCSLLFAGLNIIAKVSLDKGTSRYVLVAYGYAFGTAATAVLALLFERKMESKLSLAVCLEIFLLGLIGVVGRILYYAGLENTSPTFAAAINNLVPSMTFILAILCRMERLNLKKVSGQAKIGGTVVALGGATLMTIYKGITVISMHPFRISKHDAPKLLLYRNLPKGSLLLIFQCLLSAAFYILQAESVKKYPAFLTLTTLTSLVGTLLAAITASSLDRKPSSWKLSLDITLVAPLYSGVMIIGIMTYIQTLVMRQRGPVFVTAFRPLVTVIVAILGLFTLGEALHLGVIIGATMIVIGLYAILWGKEVEKRKRSVEPPIPQQNIEIKSEK